MLLLGLVFWRIKKSYPKKLNYLPNHGNLYKGFYVLLFTMKFLRFLQVFARVAGISFLLLVVMHFGKEGFPLVYGLSSSEQLLFVALLAMGCGILLEYMWRLVGALAIIGGYIFMAITEGTLLVGAIFPLILLAGFVHLGLWYARRFHRLSF